MEEDAGRSPKILKKTTTAGNECCNVRGKHTCVFRQGPVSLTALAHSLCAMSRSLTKLKEAVKDSYKTDRPTVALQGEDEGIVNTDILERFPLKDEADFNAFAKEIEEEEFRKQVETALTSILLKCSCSRGITKVLRYVLSDTVINTFSWRGQKRRTEKKKPFCESKLSLLIIEITKKKWPAIEQAKIEKTIASWLSQTQVKLRKHSVIKD
ncbi:uncharacterized protein LOC129000202 [Macrosteles quadrilineatus]|uniref:uncharacterized protein LOC129000202 n=1 Tax=Macrosteles quadrilineatus TaxID=74068 RepID=UPI0023E1F9C6|nr:uncharacterized protein LOC129000202 [Macrosteles quadrilineatus]